MVCGYQVLKSIVTTSLRAEEAVPEVRSGARAGARGERPGGQGAEGAAETRRRERGAAETLALACAEGSVAVTEGQAGLPGRTPAHAGASESRPGAVRLAGTLPRRPCQSRCLTRRWSSSVTFPVVRVVFISALLAPIAPAAAAPANPYGAAVHRPDGLDDGPDGRVARDSACSWRGVSSAGRVGDGGGICVVCGVADLLACLPCSPCLLWSDTVMLLSKTG